MRLIDQTLWTILLCCMLVPYIASAKDTCPPKELLLPCFCEQDILMTSIRCSKIDMMDTLVDVFYRSGDRRFKYFSLDDSSVMYLPSSSLESKRFKGLLVANVTLTSLFDRVPSAANDLELLTLSHAFLQRGVRWELFENLSKLTFLQFVKTEVKSLGKPFMKNVSKKISTLHLYDTKTTQLDDHVFESLTSLKSFQLTNGKIKTLKRSMFARPAALKILLFKNNGLEYLPDDMFSDMPALQLIVLSHNKISTFTKTIFEGVYEQLSILEIIDNPIKCDCSIQWYMSKVERQMVLGTCGSPADKSGRRLSDLVPQELDYCREAQPRGINGLLDMLHLQDRP